MHVRAAAAVLALAAVAAGARAQGVPAADPFGDTRAWQVTASDDVHASLLAVPDGRSKALCLAYDLNGTAGYASLRRAWPVSLPAGHALQLRVRGEGPANALQLKLLDASSDNVWWHVWPDFAPPRAWTTLTVPRDALAFAWGPRKDHAFTPSAMLEMTLAAGSGGGHGRVCFDGLRVARLPAAPAAAQPAAPTLASNPNAYFEARARLAPRGAYPRGFSGQQVYWTLVGVDGGADSGLLSEDGALEVGKGGFTVEPFLVDAGRLVTWADVETDHSLRDGYLPIPTVTWKRGDVRLRVTAFGDGGRADPRLVARYDVSNLSAVPREVTLGLAVRPFQVDPPTQFLNAAGGASAIRSLAWRGDVLEVDGRPRIRLLAAPDARAAVAVAGGAGLDRLAALPQTAPTAVTDPGGYASGVASYRVRLAPHATASFGLVASLAGTALTNASAPDDAVAWLRREEDTVATAWHARLDRVDIMLPPAQRHLADTLRSSLAWILMSRDGAELRPGTRSYARSWIRDGAMMADALLRMGDADAARDYARWYAPYQFHTGKVPCCVDARGADPTPENDSPGELLHLITQVYRYTGDRAFLRGLWPHVATTVAYMHGLIETQRGAACASPGTRMFCGLMPASISHEGYSAHPEHSYWDDFWALTGYDDAITAAQALGAEGEVRAWTAQRDRLRSDLYASLRASIGAHGIDYVPGSAELGDFDPTSTTIALEPGGQLAALERDLPAGVLRDTFERYWRESQARADGSRAWSDYTPYEWRNVGVFARLGWRARIPPLMDFFFAGERPAGWNGWAEVVGRDARRPRFIGDLPHAWVASDYIRATLDLFAYDRRHDGALVLGAGVQPAWLEDGGIGLRGLRTPWGRLAYTLTRDGDALRWHIDASVAPPGGIVLTWPLAGAPGATRVDGRPAAWSGGELRVRALPATVTARIVR